MKTEGTASGRVIDEHEDAEKEDQHWHDENFKQRPVLCQHVHFRTVMHDGSITGAGGRDHGQKRLCQRFMAAPLLNVVNVAGTQSPRM